MLNIDINTIIEFNKSINEDSSWWVNEQSLYSAFSSFDYYETFEEQICSIFRGLIKNHPFSNANKRTAIAVLIACINMNDYQISNKDAEYLALTVAENNYSVEEIVEILQRMIYQS